MYPSGNYKSATLAMVSLFASACWLFATPVFADQISIPGTSVSLEAPDGFTVATSFSGLQNLQDNSSITVNELPIAAYSQLLPIFTDLDTAIDNFRQRGVAIEQTHTYAIGQQEIPALIGSQPIPGGEVGKYLALYRGDVTVMLTFNVFDARILTPLVVEEVIQSVRLAQATTLQEKVDRLPFSFQVTAPFRVGDVLGGSTAAIPSFDGTDPTGLKPLVIIVRALSVIDVSSNAEVLAQQLLRGTQGFDSAEITRIEETEFSGGTGVFLAAVAGERTIVQYLRVPPDGMYIRLVAFGETSQLDLVIPAVAEIAGSVTIPQ